MLPRRVVIPLLATGVVAVLGIIAVALVSNGVFASEPVSEPNPAPTSIPVAASTPEPTPLPLNTTEPAATPQSVAIEIPIIPEKTLSRGSKAQPVGGTTSSGTTRSEPLPQPQGQTYSWEDGDRTLTILLQEDLVVQKTSEVTATDVVVVKGAVDSIVERQSTHGADAGPVFKSESGGSLMTLPGGVLLSLDPNWDESQVEDFFAQNGISLDHVSELDFIPNGFMIETEPGFPSLDLANDLAAQDGVEVASPNWSREVEAK